MRVIFKQMFTQFVFINLKNSAKYDKTVFPTTVIILIYVVLSADGTIMLKYLTSH